MEKKKVLVSLTTLFALIGVIFLVTAIATDNWVTSTPLNTDYNYNITSLGRSTFGLFNGYQTLDRFAQGPRSGELKDKPINYGLFSFSLWVTTVVLLSLSIVMGLVTIGFSIYNTFQSKGKKCHRYKKIIMGPHGLFIWNCSSLLFTTATLAVFGALFQSELSVNFLDYTQISGGWKSNDTHLDFSYFFLLGAAISFILNLILLVVRGQLKEVKQDSMILY